MRVVSYDAQKIAQDIVDNENKSIDEVTLEDILDFVEDWANEDLSSARVKIIYQDQDGNELNWKGKQVKDKVIQELDKVRNEMERAEQDGNGDLALLEGWEKALEWVLRQYEGAN